jgi:hypothetical protein
MGGILTGFLKQRAADRRAQIKKSLLHFEAKIGGQLFGQVPADRRREFFCLDEHTWVWHEEWTDQDGKRQALTTRYDVRPQGILKSQGHMSYQKLTPQEFQNFRKAVQMYGQKVDEEYTKLLGHPV